MHRTLLAIAFLASCDLSAAADTLGPDHIPWPPEPSAVKAPTRARWLFRPIEASAAREQLSAGSQSVQVELIAELPRFGGLWVLEADAGSEAQVEAQWSTLGELRRDLNGTPQLLESTRLVGAPSVWLQSDVWGDRTSSIAILDSGADTAHDDLGDVDGDNQDDPPQAAGDADDWSDAGTNGYSKDEFVRVVGWHDVTDDMPGNVGPYDYHRHGTALAGVAIGSGSVDQRYRGVAPQGRAVIVKTYNFEGQWMLWASDLLLGFDWVLAHRDSHRIRAVLVGASWSEDLDISIAVDALLDAGIAVIAPAGNDPTLPMGYPARVPDVITVGATDEEGLIAAYSTPSPGGVRALDVVAPGGTLLSPDGTVIACDNEPNDGYRGRVGSSIAAAHVAGATSLVTGVLRDSGRAWRTDRAQVRWLRSLLRVTAVETEGAEPGALVSPTRERFGWDSAEGDGLLQVRAAVDAVRRFHWPGDLETIFLQSPRLGDAVWTARMPVWGPEALRVELLPPFDSDFDLLLYLESEDGFELRAFSAQPGLGRAERIDLEHPRPGNYLLVVRRVLGGGLATLQSERIIDADTRWPLQLSSNVTQPAVTADLDGDGFAEIIAVNNLPIDASAHTWFVFRGNGSSFGLFPRTYFSSSDRAGEVLAPAVADLGGGPLIISGSAFGQIYGVDASTQLRFATIVSGAARTTGTAILRSGDKPIVVGTEDGIVLLDASGAIADSWPVEGGVSIDPLLVDLDGDQAEEIVFVQGGTLLHARDRDGNPVAGWPVALSGELPYGSPIAFGDGGSNRYVAWVDRLPSGSSRLRVVTADGAELSGFPVDFLAPGGGSAQALGGVVASRITRTGPTQLAALALHGDPSQRFVFAMHRFQLDGTQTRRVGPSVAAPAFANSIFRLTRRQFSPPRSVQMVGDEQLDWLVSTQLAWEELDVTQRRRYGSVHAVELWTNDSDGAVRVAHPRDGRLLAPASFAVAPTIDDLDGDGFADLVVARLNRIYRQSASARSDAALGWGRPRADLRRSGCYRCEADPVVDGPRVRGMDLSVAPNPFNPRTVIRWEWPQAGRVRFELVDARGRIVRSWERALPEGGVYEDVLEGRDRDGASLASGVYRLRLRGTAGELTRSVTLLR